MQKEEIQQLKSILSQPKKVVIVPHKSPDGDAVGSITALYGYLKKLGHEATMISPNDFPPFLSWLTHSDHILNYEQNRETADDLIAGADYHFYSRS